MSHIIAAHHEPHQHQSEIIIQQPAIVLAQRTASEKFQHLTEAPKLAENLNTRVQRLAKTIDTTAQLFTKDTLLTNAPNESK